VLGYGLAAAVAASGLSARRPGPGWPSGLLFLLGAAATAVSAALALVSEFLIGAWCLLCMGSWAVAVALLAVAWRACRGAGVAASIRADLSVLRASPGRSLAAAGLLVAAIAILAGVYPRYWQRAPARRALAAGSGPGAGVVVEYSDYECPMCARAHEETRALLARRPDVKLVRRQFPLDPTCNPAVKRQIHPTACALARAGICAEAQGRLPEMDDALFRNQEERLPVRALAERLGLDLGRFRDCLASPETDRRLAADIGAAVRDGVRATPTYVVGRVVEVGRLPEELLPPPPVAPAGR
jgi:2-hydroxychromene-2-carboxylate isomerase